MIRSCHILTSQQIFHRRLPRLPVQGSRRDFATLEWCRWRQCCLPWPGFSPGSGTHSWRVSGDLAVGKSKDQVTPTSFYVALSCFCPCIVSSWIPLLLCPWHVMDSLLSSLCFVHFVSVVFSCIWEILFLVSVEKMKMFKSWRHTIINHTCPMTGIMSGISNPLASNCRVLSPV